MTTLENFLSDFVGGKGRLIEIEKGAASQSLLLKEKQAILTRRHCLLDGESKEMENNELRLFQRPGTDPLGRNRWRVCLPLASSQARDASKRTITPSPPGTWSV